MSKPRISKSYEWTCPNCNIRIISHTKPYSCPECNTTFIKIISCKEVVLIDGGEPEMLGHAILPRKANPEPVLKWNHSKRLSIELEVKENSSRLRELENKIRKILRICGE